MIFFTGIFIPPSLCALNKKIEFSTLLYFSFNIVLLCKLFLHNYLPTHRQLTPNFKS